MSVPSHEHAEKLLARKHVMVRKIIRTYPDAILYVDRCGTPWTAWLEVKGKNLLIGYARGFPAEPHPQMITVHVLNQGDA